MGRTTTMRTLTTRTLMTRRMMMTGRRTTTVKVGRTSTGGRMMTMSITGMKN